MSTQPKTNNKGAPQSGWMRWRVVSGALIVLIAGSMAGCGAASTPTTVTIAHRYASSSRTAGGCACSSSRRRRCASRRSRRPARVITPTLQDVAYANTSSAQKLDLYLPEGNGPFPVVINIHPGGFKMGDKDMVPGNTGKALLNAGYAIASIDYRLSGEATFPAAVLDAKAAVRFLRANAAKYNLDPDQIAAFGQSAGGNIAAMLGTTGDVAEFDDPSLGNAGISSRVQAVINWFGPTDFSQMDAQAKAQGCPASDQTHNNADSFESAVPRGCRADASGTGAEGQPHHLYQPGRPALPDPERRPGLHGADREH